MEIVTDRLSLREYALDDVGTIVGYRSDPRYLEHYRRPPFTTEECEEFVGRCIEWSAAVPRIKFQLAITYIDSHELIGSCGIRCETGRNSRGELGYEL